MTRLNREKANTNRKYNSVSRTKRTFAHDLVARWFAGHKNSNVEYVHGAAQNRQLNVSACGPHSFWLLSGQLHLKWLYGDVSRGSQHIRTAVFLRLELQNDSKFDETIEGW
jgi:hypothetical protein